MKSKDISVHPRLKASPVEIRERAAEARGIAHTCALCPRECGVDRTSGERGYCDADITPSVAAALPHFGEEPPLSGGGGAGTIFFRRCNLRCVYCQNHQISQGPTGVLSDSNNLARIMLDLQSRGCDNVEFVSPSHHLPGLLDAYAEAVERGLDLPVVYNTNGYESLRTLELLDGVVDVYLPDLKYASNEHAARFSDCPDYVEAARTAIRIMHAQTGNLVVDLRGRALRGLILRHLVLPEDISGTSETLEWIAANLPTTVTISLMAQYSPQRFARDYPPLDRPLTEAEYDRAVDRAWDLGLENVFVQALESSEVWLPDFSEDDPFARRW